MRFSEHVCAKSAPGNFDSVRALVDSFTCYYPDISTWFVEKVTAGLANGSRRIIVDRCDNRINGLLIAKREAHERKICTLWVHPSSRDSGLAYEMVDEAIAWLDCSKPLLSLPEEAFDDFRSIVKIYDFDVCQVAPEYYRCGKVEYVLNGRLGSRATSANLQ
ncbi:hypothetical protein HFO93_07035 [Rhizobium leguminosarum]|uniref:GNAT family N-acetyltransferase n=1 Tax=Rhizobium leguminosarum TaxID=384 RepID=UPI001C965153|nr:GNAT family N-acetyltransferase [Rhizobium leguminosarum]MBY5443233.1 hypothetical protein [Rhizobium leguminosarum]